MKKEDTASGTENLPSGKIALCMGSLQSGIRKGSYFLSLPEYSRIVEERFGFTPFPGTFNIQLEDGFSAILDNKMLGEVLLSPLAQDAAYQQSDKKSALPVPARTDNRKRLGKVRAIPALLLKLMPEYNAMENLKTWISASQMKLDASGSERRVLQESQSTGFETIERPNNDIYSGLLNDLSLSFDKGFTTLITTQFFQALNLICLLPERTSHKDTLELISPYCLRDILEASDGDLFIVGFRYEYTYLSV
ncbi:MAG: DUF120 domain-containing protein [Thermoplasmata archaeon]